MKITKITNYKEYKQHLLESESDLKTLRNIENKLNNGIKKNKQLYIEGYSWTAQSKSGFLVDLLYSNEDQINFRERLVCKKTNLNNRIRGCVHIFETVFKPHLKDSIYLTEQLSMLAQWMKKKYPNLIGSEYLKDCPFQVKIKLALKLFPARLNHQDLNRLSFKSNKFKYVLSFDCFEHIPDYKKALMEIYRTLKSDGKLLFSVPFDINSNDNLIRATFTNGMLEHIEEPEYHGDPLSTEGCLSFYTFGWQLLDDLRNIGFKKVYILLYWSKKYCYLGGEQILICAEK